MSKDPDEETIKRRSGNADAVFGLLHDAYELFWIVAAIALGLFLFVYWLLR